MLPNQVFDIFFCDFIYSCVADLIVAWDIVATIPIRLTLVHGKCLIKQESKVKQHTKMPPWLICWARDFFRHWFVLIAKENPVYRCVRVIIAAEIKWPQSRKTEEKKLLLKRATTTTTTTAAAIIFLYFTLLAIFRFGYERVLFRAINREFYRTRDVCTCCYIQFLPFFSVFLRIFISSYFLLHHYGFFHLLSMRYIQMR